MRFFLSGLLFLASLVSAFAQKTELDAHAVRKGNFWHFEKEVPAAVFFEKFRKDLGLSGKNAMRELSHSEDELGFTHEKFVQTFDGIPLEGAEYILHSKGGIVKKSNGTIIPDFSAVSKPEIKAENAVKAAVKHINAKEYSWENAAAEATLKKLKNDPNASYYPKPELIFTKLVGNEYRLVYKIEINALEPVVRKDVYVDAFTGNVILSVNKLHFTDTEGTAKTRYSGTQKITTTKVSNNLFNLRESGRCGIETYNMKETTRYENAVDFTDEDNVWDNANEAKDEIAGDAHWGSEMTYDYYLQKHNRKSFDNNNSKILSYVHYDKNFANAFWNGTVMTYGDGDGDRFGPMVSIDIIAHEITHGVTEHSANLIYLNESGALNESFSDIFGVAVDFFAKGSSANFEIGEEIDLRNSGGIRSMSDPKKKRNPSTYKGQFWEFTGFDNGGVHINSGVQNYWFYLLCVGGKGKNDKGHEYDVAPIGMEKAAKIAYRNLTVYLTQTSVYTDAREGSLQAAADLYGECSPEYYAVANAWFAVGVGFPLRENDFSMIGISENLKTSCSLSANEKITVNLLYNSCQGKLPVGTKIPVSYTVEGSAPVKETITTTKEISPSQAFSYTFQKGANFSQPGEYKIFATVEFPNDPENRNNESTVVTIKKPFNFEGMTFEDPIVSEDSLYTIIGREAKLEFSTKAKKDGDFGMLFTGGMPSTSLDFPDGKNNFDINQDYRSEVCFCVDATQAENRITLNFDYRQSYTSLYELMAALFPELGGLDFKNASSFRVKVNGVQQGGIYKPATFTRDSFKKGTLDLSRFKGQKFELCFEARCFSSEAGIRDLLKMLNIPLPVQGADEVWLDNVLISGLKKKDDPTPTAVINEELENAVSLYPNPSNGRAFLVYESTKSEKVRISAQDLLGRVLFSTEKDVNFGENSFELTLPQKGMLLVKIETSAGSVVRKVLVD
jgi:Zn-dependent metalloprotease